MLAKISANIMGVSTAPLRVAELPITACTKRGMKSVVPKSAIETSVETTADVQTTRCLKSDGGRIASGARISTITNAVSITKAIESRPMVSVEAQA